MTGNGKRLLLIITGILLGGAFIFFTSETEKKEDKVFSKTAKAEKAKPLSEEILEEGGNKISYLLDSIADSEELENLIGSYSASQLQTIIAINRIDRNRLVPGQKLIIPDSVSETLMIYSPFPETLSLLDSMPKALLISQRIQAFAVYENGNLCRWGPVSSGKQTTPTPNGLHYANYKAKRKISTVNGSWVMPYYVNYMNFAGIGTHQYSLPGFPASHACVRLYMEDAKYIYEWVDMWKLEKDVVVQNGTPFMVFGEYDFESAPPWYGLAEDPEANNLLPEEVDTLKHYKKLFKSDPRNFKRDSLPAGKLLF